MINFIKILNDFISIGHAKFYGVHLIFVETRAYRVSTLFVGQGGQMGQGGNFRLIT